MIHRLTTLGALALSAMLAVGCGDDGTSPDMGPAIDARPPQRDMFRALDMPPTSSECTAESMGSTIGEDCLADADCSDGCFCNGVELCMAGTCAEGTSPCGRVECSAATCDEETRACDESPDDSLCDDGLFCNGQETCDSATGCRPGVPPFCADGDICTIDSCSDEVGACVNAPVDEDGDGAVSRSCGGDDCDDRDPTRSPSLPEICSNEIDDDCDGDVDGLDLECAPTNDFCSDDGGRGPLDITPTSLGTFVFGTSTVGMSGDYDVSCTNSSSRESGPDAVFSFTLTEARRVDIEVQGIDNDAVLSLRPLIGCPDENDAISCSATETGVEPFVSVPSLPAGDYAVIVITESETTFDLLLRVLAEGTAIDTSIDTCGTTMADVSAGGTFTGSFVGDPRYTGDEMTDAYDLPCHPTTSNYPEVAYRLSLAETRDVTLTAVGASASGASRQPYLAIVDDCGSPTPGVGACDHDTGSGETQLFLRNLEAGDYFVLVESEFSSPDATYELTVQVDPASGSNPGDDCNPGVPIDITSGVGSVDLTTLLPTPDEGTFCRVNGTGYRDFFFQFTLTSPQDVTVRTDGGSVQHWVGLSSTCGSPETDFDCFSGNSGVAERTFTRLAPGTYYVNVSTFATSGTIAGSIATAAPTPAPSNDVCSGAIAIADGSSTSFDLTRYSDDELVCAAGYLDAYYQFTLATSRRVRLAADGARRIALQGDCADTAPACSPAGAFPPSLDTTLPAGTYVVVVEADPFTASPDTRLLFSTFAP